MKPLKTSSQFLDFPAWLLLFPDVRLGYRSQFPVEIAGFLQYTLSCPAAAFAGFPVQASTWRHSPPFIPARLMSELNTASPSDPSPQLMARLARQTVATLAEVAKSVQILFFTCHPHMVALTKEVVPGLQHIDLPTAMTPGASAVSA